MLKSGEINRSWRHFNRDISFNDFERKECSIRTEIWYDGK